MKLKLVVELLNFAARFCKFVANEFMIKKKQHTNYEIFFHRTPFVYKYNKYKILMLNITLSELFLVKNN